MLNDNSIEFIGNQLNKGLAKLPGYDVTQDTGFETRLLRLTDQKLLELVIALASSNRETPRSIDKINLKFKEISALTKPEFSLYIRFSENSKNKLDKIELICNDLRLIVLGYRAEGLNTR